MQLRMSPGGSMLNSLRRRPLEPPSSLTVTTAQRSRMTGASGEVDNSVSGVPTNFFSPLSRVERPVPPPIATTRRPRSRADLSDGGHSTVLLCIEETPQGLVTQARPRGYFPKNQFPRLDRDTATR